MKRQVSAVSCAAVLGIGLALIPATGAFAEYQSGSANCGSSWSYTRANSTASITHMHETGPYWEQKTFPAGVSVYKGIWRPGLVFMVLNAPAGNFSGEVFGCSL